MYFVKDQHNGCYANFLYCSPSVNSVRYIMPLDVSRSYRLINGDTFECDTGQSFMFLTVPSVENTLKVASGQCKDDPYLPTSLTMFCVKSPWRRSADSDAVQGLHLTRR